MYLENILKSKQEELKRQIEYFKISVEQYDENSSLPVERNLINDLMVIMQLRIEIENIKSNLQFVKVENMDSLCKSCENNKDGVLDCIPENVII